MKADVLVKAFLSFYRFFRSTQFPASARTLYNVFNKHILYHLTGFCIKKQVWHYLTSVPPLSIFFSISKCATVELANSLFFLSFLVKALVWLDWACHLVFFRATSRCDTFWCATFFFCFTTGSCTTKGGVPADEGNFVLLPLCLSGF